MKCDKSVQVRKLLSLYWPTLRDKIPEKVIRRTPQIEVRLSLPLKLASSTALLIQVASPAQ